MRRASPQRMAACTGAYPDSSGVARQHRAEQGAAWRTWARWASVFLLALAQRQFAVGQVSAEEAIRRLRERENAARGGTDRPESEQHSDQTTPAEPELVVEPVEVRMEELDQWTKQFRYRYDCTLRESAGIGRDAEPVEITLDARAGEMVNWQKEVRIYLIGDDHALAVPFQVHGRRRAQLPESLTPQTESANVLFLAACPPSAAVTYRILWGLTGAPVDAPAATAPHPLQVTSYSDRAPAPGPGVGRGSRREAGSASAGKTGAGATIANRLYRIRLSERSGGILHVSRAGHSGEPQMRFFQEGIPVHFAADVWSPPDRWDHVYDWPRPPNEEWVAGPLMIRYHRWGPMSRYHDVNAHVTYTFHAEVPYVLVSTMLEFTRNRSVRTVRIGEIVTTHAETADRAAKRKEPLARVFTHYAWPEGGRARTLRIQSHLDSRNAARVKGYVSGTLAVLDRDVPWIAGYDELGGYGIASLRKSQTVINKIGGPIPFKAACTYIAQYGWGYTYWSRAAVFPTGPRESALDRNTVVAKGTVFASEQALLVFDPSDDLRQIREAVKKWNAPLRRETRGSGPW